MLIEPLRKEVIASFKINESPPVPPLKPFKTNVATLRLPQEWHVIEYDEPRQAFISREKVSSESDMFMVGTTLLVIPDISRVVGVPAGDVRAIYEKWLSALARGYENQDEDAQFLNVDTIVVDGVPSLLVEGSLYVGQISEVLQLLSVTTVKNNTLYNATFEAPVAEFYLYRPVFVRAIEDLVWH